MAKNRKSINRAALALCELILEGGNITPVHVRAAQALAKMAGTGGTYKRRYDDHEQRVMNRHLNLYRNKRDKAVTPEEKAKWAAKVIAQKRKIDGVPDQDLDLDGL